jgi:hypothetical protein
MTTCSAKATVIDYAADGRISRVASLTIAHRGTARRYGAFTVARRADDPDAGTRAEPGDGRPDGRRMGRRLTCRAASSAVIAKRLTGSSAIRLSRRCADPP